MAESRGYDITENFMNCLARTRYYGSDENSEA
jgi:hypothetical protein